MSYVAKNFGMFGKGMVAPPPPPPPEDIAPTITPEEEQAILQQTLPLPEPEQSFLARNAMPLLVGGSVLILGTIGLIVMIKI
jgi:hypothetical protein